jgi:hypothetical protein
MPRAASMFAVCLLTMTAAAVGKAARHDAAPAVQSHEQEIAEKARHIGVGSEVKLRLVDGKTLKGAIISLGQADMKLYASDGDLLGDQTIPYANIASIKQTGHRTAFWIMVGVGLAIFVPIGICAALA